MSDLRSSPMRAPRLADRLETARRRNFVGRIAELELFSQSLRENEPSFVVLFIYGPGGIGKSTLLREFARLGHEAGLPALLLDGRSIEPTPQGFWQSAAAHLGIHQPGPDAAAQAQDALERFQPGVLLIDTFEMLAPLDFWLRETLLPCLPGDCRVIIAGRNPPDPAWRTAPGWDSLLRTLALRNLRPEESRQYLAARGVPEAHHDAVLSFTHGHPLALSLAGDLASQSARSGEPDSFRLGDHPQVLRLLLERFAEHTADPNHRLALEACAQARVITEPLLARVLQVEDSSGTAREAFQWLAGLSFIEHGPEGLFPHDLARDVLDADTRWRNPERYTTLHKRIRDWIVERLLATRGQEQHQMFSNLLYLHRSNPLMKPFYEWKSTGSAYVETARPEDYAVILEMVRRYEGEESERIARYWLERQPGAFLIFRSAVDPQIGFCASLVLTEPQEADLAADPAVRSAWDFVRRTGPLRPGEHILYHRFWSSRETYQAITGTQNLIAVTTSSQWLSSRNLAWSLLVIADVEVYRPMFTYLNLYLAPEAGFSVGGRSYGVFTHDWRAEPPLAWIERVGERELNYHLNWQELEASAVQPLVVLSQPDFEEAVRQALRDYTRPAVLAGSALLRSRLVTARADAQVGDQPVDTLRGVLLEAADALKGSPKDEKLHRTLWVTYFEPAATQEAAAERLGLPFSTYRYHLAAALEKVTARLWQRELYGEE